MFIIKDPLYNGYIFWWNIIKIKKLDVGTSHLIFIYTVSALTHIFLRLFYPWDFYPYIFSAILPIYFFGYFTHIFFRLFYPYIFSAILPIFFAAILPIFFAAILPIFFAVKPQVFLRIYYPKFPHCCENILWTFWVPIFAGAAIHRVPLRIYQSSHIVVRIYCEHFGCLFLLVRLYTEIPWDYIETFWVPIFTGAAIHRWSFFFRFFPRLFSFFFFTFLDSNLRWLFSKFVYLSATRLG